ncbi:chloride channel protein [Paenibacillus humicola]|uniref:chloride channel protein n=1 Tax=Paenibacillus humicola TaxID=3110540 RepID=UPI00237B8120|nr:chloride channel protein [Paenibacillus humicola]
MQVASQRNLADFRIGPRSIYIAALAVLVGAGGACIAVVLQKMIGFFTNLFYYHKLSLSFTAPYPNGLGYEAVIVPAIGGLIIGLMARYGSDKIRGHGIPEAMEAILIGKSVVSPKVAILKPISAAISIGSGGPFGSEGPIIMSGGSIGSVIGQFLHLTAAERKVLLLSGAAAGMSATFHAPIASVFFAVELLAFEMRPRSVIPIAMASAIADFLRQFWMGSDPVFPSSAAPVSHAGILAVALAFGVLGAGLAYILTKAIYGTEDWFEKLPLHWMWWPVLGGVVIGIGGLIQPRALGVGYDSIGQLVAGHFAVHLLLGFLLVKSVIWIVALGSGTSGGVMAPLLIIGGSSGAALAALVHAPDPGVWAMIGMAAVFSGVTRSPLTTVVFMLELTHDLSVLMPVLLACTVAAGLSALILPRSILTEKIARRGRHIARDYAVDPLEQLKVSQLELMPLTVFHEGETVADALEKIRRSPGDYRYKGYPLLSAEGRLLGEVLKAGLEQLAEREDARHSPLPLYFSAPVPAISPDQTIGDVCHLMLSEDRHRYYVVDPDGRPLGMLTRRLILESRRKHWEEENKRERFLYFSRRSEAAGPITQQQATTGGQISS